MVDRIGAVAAYVYICDEPECRQQTKRLSREDGIAAAKVMARALTDAAAALGVDRPDEGMGDGGRAA